MGGKGVVSSLFFFFLKIEADSLLSPPDRVCAAAALFPVFIDSVFTAANQRTPGGAQRHFPFAQRYG